MTWPDDGRPRYVVATWTGYRTPTVGHTRPAGLSAAVLDRARAYRVVAEFQSEATQHKLGRGGVAARSETIARARALARELNRPTPG